MKAFRLSKSKKTHRVAKQSPLSDTVSTCTTTTKGSSQSFSTLNASSSESFNQSFNQSFTGVDLHIPNIAANRSDTLTVERQQDFLQHIPFERTTHSASDSSNDEEEEEGDETTTEDDSGDDENTSDGDDDNDAVLEELQETIEFLMDKVTTQIGFSRKMAHEGLQKYQARQGNCSNASSMYSFRKYSCHRMRLEHCRAMREELSNIYQVLENEISRLKSVAEAQDAFANRGDVDKQSPALLLDIYGIYTKLELMKTQIDDTAPSAVHSNAKMVEQLGKLMMENDPNF